jgi:hypothetical protein
MKDRFDDFEVQKQVEELSRFELTAEDKLMMQMDEEEALEQDKSILRRTGQLGYINQWGY